MVLSIQEGDLQFSGMDFFKLYLPFKMAEEELFKLDELNDNLKLEGEEDLILINMGTFGLIGAFTAAILITLGIWNRKMKQGRVFDSSTGHDMKIDRRKEKASYPRCFFYCF